MTNQALSGSQRKALTHLIAVGPANLPHVTFSSRPADWDTGVPGFYRTGLNSNVLDSLRALGLIACRRIFLRGDASDDLIITAEGLALGAQLEPINAGAEAQARRSAAARKGRETRARLLAEAAHRPAPFTNS